MSATAWSTVGIAVSVFLLFAVFLWNPDAGSDHMLSSSETFGTRGKLLPVVSKIISGSAEGHSVFHSLQCRPLASGSKTELSSTTMSTEPLVSRTQENNSSYFP
jgi:hypothetical protein